MRSEERFNWLRNERLCWARECPGFGGGLPLNLFIFFCKYFAGIRFLNCPVHGRFCSSIIENGTTIGSSFTHSYPRTPKWCLIFAIITTPSTFVTTKWNFIVMVTSYTVSADSVSMRCANLLGISFWTPCAGNTWLIVKFFGKLSTRTSNTFGRRPIYCFGGTRNGVFCAWWAGRTWRTTNNLATSFVNPGDLVTRASKIIWKPFYLK